MDKVRSALSPPTEAPPHAHDEAPRAAAGNGSGGNGANGASGQAGAGVPSTGGEANTAADSGPAIHPAVEGARQLLTAFMAQLTSDLDQATGPLLGRGRARRERHLEEAARALRASGLLDAGWYLDRYDDVAQAGVDPARHFIEYGYMEGRAPNAFLAVALEGLQTAEASAARAAAGDLADGEAGSAADEKPSHWKAGPLASGGVRTHRGEMFDTLVEGAKARSEPEGLSDEYDAIRDGLDVAFYLARYRDIARTNRVDPVRHYIRSGADEGRDPTADFCTRAYVRRYGRQVEASGLNPFHHYLAIGRAEGAVAQPYRDFDGFAEMLGRTPQEVDRILSRKRADLRHRLEHGVLGEMVAKASAIDPLVGGSWCAAVQAKIQPVTNDGVVSAVVAMWRLQQAAGMRQASHVILVNKARWGGGRRAEGHLAHALAAEHGDDAVVVVYTDDGGAAPDGRFPPGCREIDLANIAANVERGERQRLLVEFVRSLNPRAVFNVNSALFWDALTSYGPALAISTHVYAYFFCNERTVYGAWTGFSIKKFYRHFDVLRCVFTDSRALADGLCETYSVPPQDRHKVKALPSPVDETIEVVPAPPPRDGRRPRIFWAGRFDRQKRVDIVYAVAGLMDEADFHLWGEPVIGGFDMDTDRPPNVTLEGVYDRLPDIPLESCDVWLYTAEWDGVPQLLLEVCMTGIPLVGALAGGTEEVLLEGMSWPVRRVDDPEAYAAALRAVLADPEDARARARRLRETLAATRTSAGYATALRSALGTEAA